MPEIFNSIVITFTPTYWIASWWEVINTGNWAHYLNDCYLLEDDQQLIAQKLAEIVTWETHHSNYYCYLNYCPWRHRPLRLVASMTTDGAVTKDLGWHIHWNYCLRNPAIHNAAILAVQQNKQLRSKTKYYNKKWQHRCSISFWRLVHYNALQNSLRFFTQKVQNEKHFLLNELQVKLLMAD